MRMLFHLSRAEAALDGEIIENDCVDRKKNCPFSNLFRFVGLKLKIRSKRIILLKYKAFGQAMKVMLTCFLSARRRQFRDEFKDIKTQLHVSSNLIRKSFT